MKNSLNWRYRDWRKSTGNKLACIVMEHEWGYEVWPLNSQAINIYSSPLNTYTLNLCALLQVNCWGLTWGRQCTRKRWKETH